MLEPLHNQTYRHPFAAQIIALIGTGLLTVALALLAYELAGQKCRRCARHRTGYPVAGWVGAAIGLPATILLHAAIAASAVVIAIQLWPRNDPDVIAHTHADLPASHPHLRERLGQHGHAHVFVIDALHRHWPG